MIDYEWGKVYSWGRGSYGQLGLGNDGDWNEPTPKQIVDLGYELSARRENPGDFPIFLAAGSHHNVVVTGDT